MIELQLESLYEEYKAQIYTLCVKLAGSRSAADDLFGETWVRITEKHQSLKPDKNPSNWLYTVCLNIYRKSYAKASRLQALEFPTQEEQDDVLGGLAAPDSVEDEVSAKQDAIALHRSLNRLPDKYRLPLLLFYFRDLSYNDIGTVLKLPMSTVKFRIYRAKEHLRKEMEGER